MIFIIKNSTNFSSSTINVSVWCVQPTKKFNKCVHSENLPLYRHTQLPFIFPKMNDIRITDNEVKKCIDRLNEKKASGPDKIPITFLKQAADAITPALSFIFQQSLDTGEIP